MFTTTYVRGSLVWIVGLLPTTMDGVLNNPKESKEAQLDLINYFENIWLGSKMMAMFLPGCEEEEKAAIDRSFCAIRENYYANDDNGMDALKFDLNLIGNSINVVAQKM